MRTVFEETAAKRALRAAYRAALALQSVVGARRANGADPRVFYGGARAGDVGGPLVKVKRLREHFPERRWGFNLVYVLSGAPHLPGAALGLLKRRRIPIVANQNGVFYPAWYGGDWRARNAEMAVAYHLADHVFWQSDFCRHAADRFLGEREGPGEVLYNAVHTGRFCPAAARERPNPFTFLLTGKIDTHLFYRIEASLRGLAAARAQGLEARLVLAGRISAEAQARCHGLAAELDITDAVSFAGLYTQEQAPAVYQAADAYLMLKHNDPCPNAVIEAMACGLPVLYSATGGVPELIGNEAGIGLSCEEACEEAWEQPRWPEPAAVADGMLAIAAAREALAIAARRQAVARFDIGSWIDRHRAVFSGLIEGRA